MQTDFWRAVGDVVYGENVEAEENDFDVAFGEEAFGGASNDTLFLRGPLSSGRAVSCAPAARMRTSTNAGVSPL